MLRHRLLTYKGEILASLVAMLFNSLEGELDRRVSTQMKYLPVFISLEVWGVEHLLAHHLGLRGLFPVSSLFDYFIVVIIDYLKLLQCLYGPCILSHDFFGLPELHFLILIRKHSC